MIAQRAQGQRRTRLSLTALGWPILTTASLVLVWELAVKVLSVSPVILPAPTRIWGVLVSDFGLILHHAQITAYETVLGFLTAFVIGIPIGILIVSSRRARAMAYPLLVASQMVPKVAIAPIFLVWFGVGLMSKLTVAFLIAFFPIVISTGVGIEAVDPDHLRLFRSMGANRWRTFFKLRLPSAVPSIFAGLKVAMTLAVVGAIVGEFVGADEGLGYYIIFQTGQLKTANVYAALVVVTIIGFLLYFGVEAVERVVSPRRANAREVGVTM